MNTILIQSPQIGQRKQLSIKFNNKDNNAIYNENENSFNIVIETIDIPE